MEAKFQIKGMHCQSCATLIEEEIKSLPGVSSVNVNFNSQKAIVNYDDRVVNKTEIFQAINKAGDYEAKEEN